MLQIGPHASINKSILNTLEFYNNNKIKSIQIFTKSPVTYNNIKKEYWNETSKIKQFVNKNDMNVYIHGPYLINLCNPTEKAINILINDIIFSDKCNFKGVVIHLGKHLNKIKNSVDLFCNNIKTIIEKTKKYKYKLIIETSSGQGSEICYDVEDFVELINKLVNEHKDKIGVCIDTCHIFAAGHDISTKNGIEKYFNNFKNNEITLIHLNDSKFPLNSKKDRHEIIGKGFVFQKDSSSIKWLLRYSNKKSIPLILETSEKNFNEELYFLTNINKTSF
jgi:deoxyribonuclease-4